MKIEFEFGDVVGLKTDSLTRGVITGILHRPGGSHLLVIRWGGDKQEHSYYPCEVMKRPAEMKRTDEKSGSQ